MSTQRDAGLTADELETLRVAWRGPWGDALVPAPPERLVDAVERILATRQGASGAPIIEEVATLPRVAKSPMVMRSIRVPLRLWNEAKAKADEREESISDVVREALERYVKRR